MNVEIEKVSNFLNQIPVVMIHAYFMFPLLYKNMKLFEH